MFQHQAGRRSGVKKAFTIIELLVVMAIVTTLISLALPAISQARETANRARCLGNLKQIGVGYAMYMNNFKQRTWTQNASASGELIRKSGVYQGSGLLLAGDYLGTPDVFGCPSRTEVGLYPYSQYRKASMANPPNDWGSDYFQRLSNFVYGPYQSERDGYKGIETDNPRAGAGRPYHKVGFSSLRLAGDADFRKDIPTIPGASGINAWWMSYIDRFDPTNP